MTLKDVFNDRILTFSNILSLLRILLVPFVAYSLFLEKKTGLIEYRYNAIILLAIIVLSDFFDGYLARALNQVSKLGQFLDPAADKIATMSLAFLLYRYRDFPFWVVGICLLRDCYGVIGGFLLFHAKGVQVRANLLGKIMVAMMAFSGFVFILDYRIFILGISLQWWSIYLTLFFLVSSTLLYWKTYSKVYFEQIL